ncbi:hypothetical protein AYO39_01575 [Actinobacteria bacterium SCGC AG-212-D09]|nr:hypothetical protein AYO39_01575 [Actinobacteria bacterium SCGC AG-212-D09]
MRGLRVPSEPTKTSSSSRGSSAAANAPLEHSTQTPPVGWTLRAWLSANKRGVPRVLSDMILSARWTHVSLFLALVGTALLPTQAAAVTSGPNGRILFESNRTAWTPQTSSHKELFTMNADGSGLSQLTTGAGSYDGTWSPDGRQIAFGRAGAIWLMDANGSHARRITTGDLDFGATWSPDGKKIAFDRSSTGLDSAIWVVNADGTNEQRLTPDGFDGWPAWSPAGKQIAFARRNAIWVMAADGSGGHPVTEGGDDAEPSFAPGGKRIAFSRAGDIWIANSTGGGEHQLTTSEDNYSPAWSPDGRWIVFSGGDLHAAPVDFGDVRVIKPDGTGERTLTFPQSPRRDGRPDWGRT